MYRRYLMINRIKASVKSIAVILVVFFFITAIITSEEGQGTALIAIIIGLIICGAVISVFLFTVIRNEDFSKMKLVLHAVTSKEVDAVLAGMTKLDRKNFVSDRFFCSLSERTAVDISNVSDFSMYKEHRRKNVSKSNSGFYTAYFLRLNEYDGKCHTFSFSDPHKVIKAYEILKQAKGDIS